MVSSVGSPPPVDKPDASGASESGKNPPSSGEVDSLTTVKDLQELKKKAPKVYKAMMMGVAQNITNEMKHHQDRMKEMIDEGRRNAGISNYG